MENASASADLAGRDQLIRTLAFTLVLSSMSATMFNFVLPEIRLEFGLSLSQVSWVSSIYLLIYAVGSVIYGKLADKYRLKNLLTFGLLLFAAGSIIGLVAMNYGMVLLGRTLQATGASVIPATAMVIPVRYFPLERRGRALGISATGLAIGSALGPVVSAFVVSVAHWRWLFCIPVLVLATLPFYRKYLTDEKGREGRIDWLGGGLLAGAVALLLLAVTQERQALVLGSGVLFLLFVWRIRTAAEPFISPRLFRNKSYSLGLGILMLISGIGYSLHFMTPQMISDVHDLGTEWIGFIIMPAAAVSAILARKGGKIGDAKGADYLYSISSTLLILGFALLSSFSGWSPAGVSAFLILAYVGQMFMGIALNLTISSTLPKDQIGVGMGMLSLSGFISSAVATGIYGKVVDQGAKWRLNPLVPDSDATLLVYGNIYLVLAALHVALLVLYHFAFGKSKKRAKSSVLSKKAV